MKRVIKFEDITLDDIHDFINSHYGNSKDIPEEKLPVMQYIELLDKIRGMDLRIGEFGSRDSIIKYLIKCEHLSRYLANQAYEDAMEFFYSDSTISREAMRNRLAQRMETAANASVIIAKDAKELTMAAKLYKDVYIMLGLDKDDPIKIDPEASGKLAALYSYDPKRLGWDSVIDPEAVKEFINSIPLTDRQKELALQETLIFDRKFPIENENLRKS